MARRMPARGSRLTCAVLAAGLFSFAGSSIFGQTSAVNPPVKIYFFHLDHLGTPRVITDVAGQPVSKHKYLPFGEELTPMATTNTHKFTGHERDAESGADYMKARYEGGGLGRFFSVDPGDDTEVEIPQSWNKYSYVRNNPTVYTDPTGRSIYSKVAKVAYKLYKTGDIALAVADTVADAQTVASPDASLGDRLWAAVSLASELSPVSVSDVRDAGRVLGIMGNAKDVGRTVEGVGNAGRGITNPIPQRLARVVPGSGPVTTLGREGAQDVFVTAADDIAGMNAAQIAERVGIPQSGAFTVIEFTTPPTGLASPVFRTNPGFAGGGLTSGGAREFVLPNGPIPANAVVRMVP